MANHSTENIIFLTIILQLIIAQGHIHLSRNIFNHLVINNSNLYEKDFTPAPIETYSLFDSQPAEIICAEYAPNLVCVPSILCSSHVYDEEIKNCQLSDGVIGICCKIDQNGKLRSHADISSSDSNIKRVSVNQDEVDKAMKISKSHLVSLLEKESMLLENSKPAVLPEGTPSSGYAKHFIISQPKEMTQITNASYRALEVAFATRALRQSEGFTNEQIEFNTIESELPSSFVESACLPQWTCSSRSSRYRTLDGSCNNPLNSILGVAQTPFSRLLPPSYSDGVWSPRMSRIHGQPLPSPRLICSEMFSDVDRPDKERTLMFMQFGQFLAHDISRSVITRFSNGSGISCCSDDGFHQLPAEMRHYACMPIIISPQDKFYQHFNQKCMNFVRSVLAPRIECNLGYSQQMNRVTHFLDGSVVYGTDLETLNDLREFNGGRLKMFMDFGRQLLPLTKNSEECLTMEQGSACFSSGDNRNNQMISLVAIHTLWAREHNRLAHELSLLNPHWSDERIFQEARRILVAELQHITYSQWLPEVIGHKTMQVFGLSITNQNYSTNYDPNVDPSITNEFITAAMRFGHSIVDGKLKIYGSNKLSEVIDIPEVMFYPSRMRKQEFFDEIISTLTLENAQVADTSVAEALTKYLFRGGNPFGFDLISINIQRGRDHGLRPYNDYREVIGLRRYNRFEDFGPQASKILQFLYESPDDIDLYVGGLMETRASEAATGPTFRDIIADQFVRLRRGDKYFYDLHPSINPGHFTIEQLREIKQSTLARIICDNRDGIILMKQAYNVFRKPGSFKNKLLDCSSPKIPHMNLIYWQEKF